MIRIKSGMLIFGRYPQRVETQLRLLIIHKVIMHLLYHRMGQKLHLHHYEQKK